MRNNPRGTHHAFASGPNDVEGLVAHLPAHGIPFYGPATHRDTAAASVYFSDPDGNALEFVCWDGYPRLAEVPLLQHIERIATRFDWNPAARRARPRALAAAPS